MSSATTPVSQKRSFWSRTLRWSYIVPRVFIVVAITSFIHWGLDPLLRWTAVQTLQSITGARADIGSLNTTFFPPGITLEKVALADAERPGTNLIAFDQLELSLAGQPLLRKQFVVDKGRLTGVCFRSQRADDGQLEPTEDTPESSEPSWMSEKLRSMSDEWLANLTQDIREQLDPNVLETYRVGNTIYARWDDRFQEMSDRTRLLEPRFRDLKDTFENAKQGDPIQQIEQYLQAAQKAEQLTIEARQIQQELTDIAPEVRSDFSMLDQARKNDQQMVMRKVSLLRPDARRISETLLGKEMYLQLQKMLSWIETADSYHRSLKEQVKPPRPFGKEFQFEIQNPSPNFVIRELLVSGHVDVDGEQTPFEAQLCDVTENAPLLGSPCVLRLKATGRTPVQLKVCYDATTPQATTEILADYRNPEGRIFSAGRQDKVMFSGNLTDLSWNMQLRVTGSDLAGQVQLDSVLKDPLFTGGDDIRPELLEAAADAVSGISQIHAALDLSGTLKQPEMDLHSDVGEQISEGLQTAFSNQVRNAKKRLAEEINALASDQVSRLTLRFESEYDRLTTENAQLIRQAQEIQKIVASIRSGNMDTSTMIRQVRSSGVLPQKQQKQVDRAFNSLNNAMKSTKMTETLIPPGRIGIPRRSASAE
ncbi:MAG: TIGR03545 family protein [Planctomyces sp.]